MYIIFMIFLFTASLAETLVWMRPTTSGTPPSPRDSHTFSSWKNKIIVIGGEDGHDYYLSDVHILDTGINLSYPFLLFISMICDDLTWLDPILGKI
jgi:hypothetical protein